MSGEEKELVWAEIRDMLRLTATHYGLWFAETERVLGLEAALGCETEAGGRFMEIAGSRLQKKLLGDKPFSAKEALGLGLDELEVMADSLAVNWLAADGVWFQAVEKVAGMIDAKRVNDACWSRFAPLEAQLVMERLGISKGGGLDALKSALAGRMYARVNQWRAVKESGNALIFTMIRCRVQEARTRKGLPEYPCKTGGVTEYTSFARQVDPRIEVSCIGCPPDEREPGYACSWRFTVNAAHGVDS
jgi:hypothetical protein